MQQEGTNSLAIFENNIIHGLISMVVGSMGAVSTCVIFTSQSEQSQIRQEIL